MNCQWAKRQSGTAIALHAGMNHLFRFSMLLLLLVGSARAQQERIWISDMGGEDTITVQVGDVVEFRVNIQTNATEISGFQCFMSFPEELAEPVPYNETPTGWFQNANLFPGAVVFADDHDSRPGMTALPDNQLDWCYQTGLGDPRPVYTANGIACRFRVRFLQPIDNYLIEFDHDNNHFRNTLFWAGQSAEERNFYREFPMVVNVIGIDFGPLPDVYLTTPSPRDSINLFDYLEEYDGFHPDSVSFSWQSLGANDVCTLDSLRDGERFWMIFDATGPGTRIDLAVRAHAMGLSPLDTLTVFRGDPPIIDPTVADQDPFLFWLEDQQDSLWLDNHVTDLDDDVSTLSWSVVPDANDVISVEITPERLARFVSPPDWFGADTLHLRVEDPGGLADTSRVICHVSPINDAPALVNPGQLEVHTGLPLHVDLETITSDVDNEYDELIWTVSGDTTQVRARVLVSQNLLEFEVVEGTPLWTEAAFQLQVTDPGPLSDEITLDILVSSYPPIWSLPPEYMMFTGGSATIPLNDYVSDQDNLDSELDIWLLGNQLVSVQVEPESHVATLQAPQGWTGVEELVVWARDTDDNISSDTTLVVVVQAGIPLVAMVPDLVFLPGEERSLWLDGYVWDSDTPDNLMSWEIDLPPTTIFNYTLDNQNRVVHYTAPMIPGTIDQALYIVTDDQNHTAQDLGALAVVDPSGQPLVLPIEEIWMNANSVDSSIVLDRFVYDYDHDADEMSWTVSGGAYTIPSIRQSDRRLIIQSQSLPGNDLLQLQVTDPDQRTASGSVLVHVLEGNPPILSAFSDRYLIAGERDTLDNLSSWVYDPDAGDQISWSFSVEAGSPLSVSHYSGLNMAVIQSSSDHTGSDLIYVTVGDLAQNMDSGTITVHSLENEPPQLELGLMPNPAEADYLDFVIMASEPLRSITASRSSTGGLLALQALFSGDGLPIHRARLGNLSPSLVESEVLRVEARDLPGYSQVAGNLTIDSLVFSTSLLLHPGDELVSPNGELVLGWMMAESSGRWLLVEEAGQAGALWQLQGPATGQLIHRNDFAIERLESGVWRRLSARAPLSSGDRLRLATTEGSSLPEAFGLCDPTPNPFNPAVTLAWSLVQDGDTRLTITDLLGRRVRVLQSGWQAAGQYRISWNGCNQMEEPVASGIYFALLEQSGKRDVRKLMLVR